MATVKLEALRAAMDVAKRVTATASKSIPTLANVLVDEKVSGLRLLATDLTTYLTITLPLAPQAPSAPESVLYALLPAARLAKIAAGLGGGKKKSEAAATLGVPSAEGAVPITVGERKLSLQTGGSPTEFPAWPEIKEEATVGSQMYDATDLASSLSWVLLAAATDDSRYILNGVHVRAGRLTATDGHRLHQAPLPPRMSTLKIPAGLEAPILPRDSAAVLLAAVAAFSPKGAKGAKGAPQVEMRIFQQPAAPKEHFLSYARFTIAADLGTVEIVSRLVNDAGVTFPDYAQIIPAPDASIFTVPAAPLGEALKLAKDLGSRFVVLRAEGSKLAIESKSENYAGKSSEEVALTTTATEPRRIALGADYLLEALDGVSGAEGASDADGVSGAILQIQEECVDGKMTATMLCARFGLRLALVMSVRE